MRQRKKWAWVWNGTEWERHEPGYCPKAGWSLIQAKRPAPYTGAIVYPCAVGTSTWFYTVPGDPLASAWEATESGGTYRNTA